MGQGRGWGRREKMLCLGEGGWTLEKEDDGKGGNQRLRGEELDGAG